METVQTLIEAPRTIAADLVRLVVKLAAIAAGVLLALFAIVALVPDGNDYALATLKKHARLAASVPRKIVFVGGSNLAFGADSSLIERTTGRYVVNMGMDGYLGVRYMLEEVKPFLRPSDTVVISLEYDSFFKSVDGAPSDLFMIVKANPRAFSYLSWEQVSSLIESVPFVAQQKLLRLARNAGQFFKRTFLGTGGVPEISVIESAAGFNEYGDLVSHLGLDWPIGREDGIDLTKTALDPDVVGLLTSFAKEMKGRGVDVIISYTPAIRYYYDRHKPSIDRLHTLLTNSSPLIVPRPPGDFVFDEPLFFDTVYHLNEKGRAIRSRLVATDLVRHLQERERCSPDSRSPQPGECGNE